MVGKVESMCIINRYSQGLWLDEREIEFHGFTLSHFALCLVPTSLLC